MKKKKKNRNCFDEGERESFCLLGFFYDILHITLKKKTQGVDFFLFI